ncbi:Hydrogenase transcriptional regulatory protein hupR1 [Rubripirellula obstinata]|uniref:Hydrogenase transcriptional regulatory protein hupR1 n=1 Tax=Rubripirellula obstinata TaxID=406547 RepID=A0A5B1CMG0_9BACT|nr:response regulator [Rubripirellula obstinata]KAA1260740.1 Hydrogenase transcriptional regulatory protein hupR1 [Rubripirellula obstinata]
MNPISNKILYVDDELIALKYFTQFYGEKFDVLTASSADEAIKLIEQDPRQISVLVTDQKMPGRTGVELMEHVRGCYPHIVRILTTAYSNMDAAIKAVNEGGAFRYLTKPWNEGEMEGTLLRASEYHAAMVERDRLLSEKLSVLHRLIVMDRVRGLATMATAINGRLRNAWSALVGYMEQSPVTRRVQVQMEEIAGLNMVALARHESEAMVKTVQMILSDTVAKSTGDDAAIDIAEVTKELAEHLRQELSEDDLELEVSGMDQPQIIAGDKGMIENMIRIMVRRLSDIQELPSKISIELSPNADEIQLIVRGGFASLEAAQIASFFAAAIPLRKWPIGLDMDLLSCFMISHHLGGQFNVQADDETGPALIATLPRNANDIASQASALQTINPEWFDTVYESLEKWQSEILSETA